MSTGFNTSISFHRSSPKASRADMRCEAEILSKPSMMPRSGLLGLEVGDNDERSLVGDGEVVEGDDAGRLGSRDRRGSGGKGEKRKWPNEGRWAASYSARRRGSASEDRDRSQGLLTGQVSIVGVPSSLKMLPVSAKSVLLPSNRVCLFGAESDSSSSSLIS